MKNVRTGLHFVALVWTLAVLFSGCGVNGGTGALDQPSGADVQGGGISKAEAERIAVQYLKDDSPNWAVADIQDDYEYWIVRFSPASSMPERLELKIDKATGEIVEILTDS